MFDTLIEYASLNMDLTNDDNETPLSMCLLRDETLGKDCMAAKLIAKGCSLNLLHPETGE